jgi:hypothetical protein
MHPRYWHYWLSLLLCAALVPVLRSQHLPLKFDWTTLFVAYWLFLTAQAIFLAALLYLIGFPSRQAWEPLVARYRQTPVRIAFTLLYFAILAWAIGVTRALVLTVDTIALLELRDRQQLAGVRHAAAAIVPPAAYFFFGFLMVLAYNCAIVSARFNFANDPALAAIDRWLLHGHSVGDIAHWAVHVFPLSFFRFLEFIYFGMFPQIGAAMILVALCVGRHRALQLVGTLLMSYYLALAVFYLWPSQGPYYLCPNHFSRFPASLQAYTIQKTLISDAMARWHHELLTRIPTDYFIGLPCMHVAQPLIVIWFLRRWRRIVIALAAYDVLLVAAIIMLEWHYIIDIIAGVFVAAMAIVIVDWPFRRENVQSSAPAGATG